MFWPLLFQISVICMVPQPLSLEPPPNDPKTSHRKYTLRATLISGFPSRWRSLATEPSGLWNQRSRLIRLATCSRMTNKRMYRYRACMMTSSNGNIFRVTGHLCGEFTGPRRSFDVFFDLRLNQRLSKQSWGWWFETLPRPLWRHCNVCDGSVRLCAPIQCALDISLQWRHNGRVGVSNRQPHECLLNRLFRIRSKKSPATGEFPAQMASNAENVSIWWRHHVVVIFLRITRGRHPIARP